MWPCVTLWSGLFAAWAESKEDEFIVCGAALSGAGSALTEVALPSWRRQVRPGETTDAEEAGGQGKPANFFTNWDGPCFCPPGASY